MNPTHLPGTAARLALGLCTLLAAALLSAPNAPAQNNFATPYTFTTLAGSPYILGGVGIVGSGGADGTGAAARFADPLGVATDPSGNIYVADNNDNAVRMITQAGVVTTIAGTLGVPGSADGIGAAARFKGPQGVAYFGGALYVTDTGNSTIRKINLSNFQVSTFAATPGSPGNNDGTGGAASFNGPLGIAADSGGNLYVADQINSSIRKITTAGVVTTFAGTSGAPGFVNGTAGAGRFSMPSGVTVDGSGNVYVADTGNNEIRAITPGAVVTTLAGAPQTAGRGSNDGTGSSAKFYGPYGIVVDSGGNLYVSDQGNDLIRKIVISSAAVTTISGVATIVGFVDGTGTSAQYDAPAGAALDGNGNLFVADSGNGTIRKIVVSSVTVSTLAGTPGAGNADGTGSAAEFNSPGGVAVDTNGNIYVADTDNYTVRKITPGGTVTTLAGTAGAAGSADGTGPAARFYVPYAVAVDSGGNVYVADTGNNTIRKITPGGAVSTLAGTAGPGGDTNGTGSAASFNKPLGIAVDSGGNVYVSEDQNYDIRKITSGGVVTTLAGTPGSVGSKDGTGAAAQFNLPASVAVDNKGNLYVADYANNTIRKIVIATGVVSTLAGNAGYTGSADGTGSAATFWDPVGVAADANGNVYVGDTNNNMIRMITSAGVVTSLAGNPGTPGHPDFGSTDGTGSGALFFYPEYLASDAAGNLYVGDTGNNTIRRGSITGAPFIQTQPTDQYAQQGGSATFTVAATGGSTLSYQWNFNGTAIPGAMQSSYTITNAQASNSGPYTVTVTDTDGSSTSNAAHLFVNSGGGGARLINISTRAMVGTGANILIPGLVIGGGGTETLLIRADGPALSNYGVQGVLAAPSLTVYTSPAGVAVASNTGWGTNSNPSQIASVAAQVGAFPLASGSADCALIVNLGPGAYTVQVSGVNNTTGVALAEVYEVSSTGTTRLINISTRAQVGTGANILIPGFVIGGSGNEQLLVRADGPALNNYGVQGVLATPSLTVYTSPADVVVASNTGWGTASNPSQIASVAAFVGAFALAPGSADSAQVVNLTPGAYTIQISGVSNTTGVALAEVYEVQ